MAKQKTIPVPDSAHLASAYLFIVGRQSDGKRAVNEWLATLVIDPIDQVWVEPGEKIAIDDVRTLQRDVQLAPVRSSRRAIVLPKAHHLSLDAAHAMLKILEDPPPHALIILVAEYEDQLLPTIVSRCQRWRLAGVDIPRRITDNAWDISRLRQNSYAERLARAEQWAKGETFADDFDQLLMASRAALFAGKITPETVEQLVKYRTLASTNVTPRLLAEVTLLSLGRVSP